MERTCSIADAKSQLPRLVHDVEAGQTITLTRRGRPVAVLITVDELARLRRRGTRFSSAYEELRQRFDFVELDIDPEVVFERSADTSGGRDLPW